LQLRIFWPAEVSALHPVPVEVELLPPPGMEVSATVQATLFAPSPKPWLPGRPEDDTLSGNSWRFELKAREGHRYVAEEPFQPPLESPAGTWWLVIDARAPLPVMGERARAFYLRPLSFRDLTQVLPKGVELRVPTDFAEVSAQGDRWAGARVWRYGNGELGLWWAPGPAEPLQLHNAIMMLEATHPPEQPPRVLDVEEIEWSGQIAFRFREHWPGKEGGQAEALVTLGPDYRLLLLRVRAIDGGAVPPLFHQIKETLVIAEK